MCHNYGQSCINQWFSVVVVKQIISQSHIRLFPIALALRLFTMTKPLPIIMPCHSDVEALTIHRRHHILVSVVSDRSRERLHRACGEICIGERASTSALHLFGIFIQNSLGIRDGFICTHVIPILC